MPAKNWHMQYIADRMRPDEITHWLAISGMDHYDPELAGAGFCSSQGLKYVVTCTDGSPAAVVGWFEDSPGCWTGWAIGTMDGWAQQWRSITKSVRHLIEQLELGGARRLSISTIAERTAATDWYLNGLQLKYEGMHRAAGAQGQDIVFFSRVKGDSHGRR